MTRRRYLHPPWCVLAAADYPARRRGPVPPRQRVPGQHLHPGPTAQPGAGDQPRPTATSSSPGRAAETTRTARGFGIFARRFSSAGAPQAGEFQVNTFTTLERVRSLGGGSSLRRLRRRLAEPPGRLELRRVRPPLLEHWCSSGERVPGQLLHDVPTALPLGGGGCRRRLRDRLAYLPQPGRLGVQRLHRALLERGRPHGHRVPGQHLHAERPALPVDRGFASTASSSVAEPPTRLRLWHVRPAPLGAGAPVAIEFPVNTYTTERQDCAAVAAD